VNDRVSQILLFLSILCARLQFFLCFLLLLVRELVAGLDPVPTHLKTFVDFRQLAVRVVEAVHAAPSGLVIHRVEFFVQEGVEADLSHFESLMKRFKHLGRHVFQSVSTVLVQPKEFSQLFRGLFVGVEVHFSLFL